MKFLSVSKSRIFNSEWILHCFSKKVVEKLGEDLELCRLRNSSWSLVNLSLTRWLFVTRFIWITRSTIFLSTNWSVVADKGKLWWEIPNKIRIYLHWLSLWISLSIEYIFVPQKLSPLVQISLFRNSWRIGTIQLIFFLLYIHVI